MNLEIWFPQQDEASVFLESSIADADEEGFHETVLFALYAARQIANLRHSAPSLIEVLRSTDTSNPLIQAQLRLEGISVRSPGIGSQGRKGFTAELRPNKRNAFKMKPHGFGMTGAGVDYYAPTSTLALLYWLLERRKDDSRYQRALSATAENIGIAGSQGSIGVTTQVPIAMQAAMAAWEEAAEVAQTEQIPVPEGLDANALPFSWGALVTSTRADIERMFEDTPEGYVVAVPNEVSIPYCRMRVALAANLLDDERVVAAYHAVEAAVDEATEKAANAHVNAVIAKLLEEKDLMAAADALHRELYTTEVDSAVRRGAKNREFGQAT
jgi:hypothetical protein